MTLPCRYVQEIGRQGYYIAMWPKHSEGADCVPGSIHSVRRDVEGWTSESPPSLNAPDARGWDGVCEKCGKPVPWDEVVPCTTCAPANECSGLPMVTLSAGSKAIFDTEDGRLHPGDMYFRTESHACFNWDNCEGRHLHVVLPNGHDWDVDSRASNCTLREDRTHRCWVRVGDPPDVHVTKEGLTCAAGAGSIASGDYHGFLRHGVLEP